MSELSSVELFVHGGEIPEEIVDLLGPLVPPLEKFQLEGLERTPYAIDIDVFDISSNLLGGRRHLFYDEPSGADRPIVSVGEEFG